MITTKDPRIRLRGHGRHLRLRANSGEDADPLALIRECCRAGLALDKALGEAIASARSAGRGWGEIAQALGAGPDAGTRTDVIDARVEQQRLVWQRFWPGGAE